MNMQYNTPATRNRRFKVASAVAVAILTLLGCDNGAARRAAIEKAQAQVRRIAEELDKRTTETGVYMRVKEDEIKENDPWGTRLSISYSQGGVAETIAVRSAGPDRELHTDDDVVANGMAMNFKGVGEGIKKNVETTATNAARGAVKGAVEGMKESIKDSLPFKRKRKADSEVDTEKDPQQDAQREPGKPAE